jgi:YfiH family protein
MHPDWLIPDWPAPANVHAVMTTRSGGISHAPFNSFNPATHVGDDPASVLENRRLLRQWLPAEPLWLNQVHGVAVVGCGEPANRIGSIDAVRSSPHPTECSPDSPPEADASVAFQPNQVRAVLTADCLPVLFCNEAGTVVAAAHAGWRGLAAGVLEETVRAMQVPPETILVWLGAAIGPNAFEVGEEVRENFIAQHTMAGIAFRPSLPGTLDGAPRKWLADIYALARIRLANVGVERVYGGGLCTFNDAQFFSYRRELRTGRMASLIWCE